MDLEWDGIWKWNLDGFEIIQTFDEIASIFSASRIFRGNCFHLTYRNSGDASQSRILYLFDSVTNGSEGRGSGRGSEGKGSEGKGSEGKGSEGRVEDQKVEDQKIKGQKIR
ncbi:hypothetical protein RhiirB3_379705 [Rhizophagus irregularis]|nr:hypothetical protein RhiirB3_379705 [Rhizophagus irregularis]